jgi:uncharacterized protein (DUF488 family)
MLFQRQRVLLTLLDAVGGKCAPTDFQKLLFLYTRQETEPSYEFVPYHFGCFSFTTYADRRRLLAQGLLEDDEREWRLTDEGHKVARKDGVAPLLAKRFSKEHATLRGNALVAEVYLRFPYYATRSKIIDKVLPNAADRQRVEQARPPKAKAGLLTIGYEGKCLEAYLNQLLHAGVSVLCDVRRNPLSRKYGFSKSTLSQACEGIGVRYHHLPQLGIASEKRRELKTQTDYDRLFEEYERRSLPQQTRELEKIQEWIKEGERVALTCYELHFHQCHRHCVAEALEHRCGGRIKALHL